VLHRLVPGTLLLTTVTLCSLLRNSISAAKRAVSDWATHRRGSPKCRDRQFRIPTSIVAHDVNIVEEVSMAN